MNENNPVDIATYVGVFVLIIVVYILIAKFIILDLLIPMHRDTGIFIFGAISGIFFEKLKICANLPIKKD